MNRLAIGIIIIAAGALAASISIASIDAARPPELPNKQVAQQVSRTYSNALDAAFVAQELHLPLAAVEDVTIGARGAGCSVTFASTLIVHQDEHTDALGRTTITVRDQVELEGWQVERLDRLMQAEGCFRSR